MVADASKHTVAVIAHRQKSFGGGLEELRAALADAGVREPMWCEIEKSKEAPRKIDKCLKRGADLVLAWGGDGTIQRCVDALVRAGVGPKVALSIFPAGTANLLAENLGVPKDVRKAVDIALKGRRRQLDLGLINDEYFAVMAGTGFDALMIRDASTELKDSMGRAAYIWTGLKHLRDRATQARITLDGEPWFSGRASCVLLGNVGTLLGGVKAFPDAEPTDGLLEIGVVQAESSWEWIRVLARTAVGAAESSPLVTTGRGRKIEIRLGRKQPYQVDGGDRRPMNHLVARAKHAAITVCVPADAPLPDEAAPA